MEGKGSIYKSERRDTYFTYIEARRRMLLRFLLFIFVSVAAIFIPVNISIGDWVLASFEIAIVVFGFGMLYFLRKPELLTRCSAAFVGVGAVWAILASGLPSTDYSIFVWNAFVPAFSFFLLGKRWALPLCSVFVPIIIVIFIYRHLSGDQSQPLEVILNLVVYTVFITVLYMYYESTRAHTEKVLIDDIEARKKTEAEKEALIVELQSALAEVKALSGLLPVCSCCKKIRDDSGYWNKLEVFIEDRSDAQFSHGMCPECAKDMYPDVQVDFTSLYMEEFPGWSEEEQKKVDQKQC